MCGWGEIKSLVDYKDYSKTYYGLPALTVVGMTDEKKYRYSQKEYNKVPSDIFKPLYIHMGEEEMIEKLNNIEKNTDNLSEDDAIDRVLLSMFPSKRQACGVGEKIIHLFRKTLP